jgi:cytochrome P450
MIPRQQKEGLSNNNLKSWRDIPGYGLWHVVSLRRQYKQDPLQFLTQLHHDHGKLIRLEFGPKRIFILNDPDDISHVLQTHYTNYLKLGSYKITSFLLGQGLLNSNGSLWLKQRRIVQPFFQPRLIPTFMDLFSQETEKLCLRWEKSLEEEKIFNLTDEMVSVTFNIITHALCSADLSQSASVVNEAFQVALKELMARLYTRQLPRSIPTPSNYRMNRSIEYLQTMVEEIVQQRRANPGSKGDLLDHLMSTHDQEDPKEMTDHQLRDQILTLLAAGHDTTAHALSWTLYLLSQHPAILNAVQQECQTILQGRFAKYEDLSLLSFTRQVLDESMRLFPPVWSIERTVLEEDCLGGYRIPSGATVIISPYVVHRSPLYWENPDHFEPERFHPSRVTTYHPYQYFPFLGGPRVCVAKHFALAEAQFILSGILQRFIPELATSDPVKAEPYITLRPKNLFMRFKKRCDPDQRKPVIRINPKNQL